MRVLFVDDEALIVLLAASWLEDLGCEVETAFNDVNMPGMSGHELAKRATDIRPGLNVVLLSGGRSRPARPAPYPKAFLSRRPEARYQSDARGSMSRKRRAASPQILNGGSAVNRCSV
jgi:hypothetical protein